MIRDAQELDKGKIKIDLRGPDGNAFFILGIASKISKTLGHTKDEIEAIQNDMKSSDYEHLIEVFDKHYGDYVDLYR
tara:strand:+ start:2328 stop:2558 length:231 start_codon:yes stop_codon:yes gene_type:complete